MTSNIKSPFLIVPEFISPKKCDEILSKIEVAEPNRDIEGRSIPLERHHEEVQADLFSRFQEYTTTIEDYFDCSYKGTEQINFQMLPENPKEPALPAGCMNSKYLRKKWVKVADNDLTVLIWFKDYHDSVPLDPRVEVFGGKLEFPLYNFSFVPQRGTMIIYPSGPHFISVTSPVLVSDLYQARFNLSVRTKEDGMWMYSPQKFQYDKKRGMIDSWFSDHLS